MKKLLVEQVLENEAIKDVLRKRWRAHRPGADRCGALHGGQEIERKHQAVVVVRMSASALRYAPRPGRNIDLQERIPALAHRHRRYGIGMIHLMPRQEGQLAKYKRMKRLYLQGRRRKRKKVLMGERQPLLRPNCAGEVWSMGFGFDRTAEGRGLKCLVIVDDATHESGRIEVAWAISGLGVSRVLNRLALSRDLPKVIPTDNGKKFCGKAMVTCPYERGVHLRLIEPGKPNQNAYIERFNKIHRTEVLDIHLFEDLDQVREITDIWLRQYNEERPNESLGNLTPSLYRQQRERETFPYKCTT